MTSARSVAVTGLTVHACLSAPRSLAAERLLVFAYIPAVERISRKCAARALGFSHDGSALSNTEAYALHGVCTARYSSIQIWHVVARSGAHDLAACPSFLFFPERAIGDLIYSVYHRCSLSSAPSLRPTLSTTVRLAAAGVSASSPTQRRMLQALRSPPWTRPRSADAPST